MRPTPTVASEDTLQRAIALMTESGVGTIPVTTDGRLVGIINEQSLVGVIGQDLDLQESCTAAMSVPETIHAYDSGSEALRRFEGIHGQTLVVIDDQLHVRGVLAPYDLFPRRRTLQRPAMVGGMATPFGVYLTSGNIRGGVSHLAVMATGVLMFSSLVLCVVVTSPLLAVVDKTRLPQIVKDFIDSAIPMVAFLGVIRFIPLSGTHGAEHMVVHAIERGEDLTPEVVKRMPRVHPRCGTNLAVAMSLFFSIEQFPWIKYEDVRFLAAAILTMFLYGPLGSFVQQFVTTKKPNAKQLRSGIKAGNEVIQRYATAKSSEASVLMRIWNSGMIQVISGSVLTYLVIQGLELLFHFSIPGLT